MSRAQRFTFLGIAVVIAVVAVIVLADSSEDDSNPPANNAGATATATPTTDQPEASPGEETPTPTATPKPQPPLLDGSKVVQLDFTEGETVRFRVVSDTAEEVHIHGYDIAKDLEPGKVITVSFPATITGGFDIEYEGQGKQIAELQVHPK